MWYIDKNKTSINEWIEWCKFNPVNEMLRLDGEDFIVFIYPEELLEICNYLIGEKKIPTLKNSEDILGDIEGGDFEADWIYGGFDCTYEELSSITDTRGIWNHHTAEHLISHTNTREEGRCVAFTGRKGYASIIWRD